MSLKRKIQRRLVREGKLDPSKIKTNGPPPGCHPTKGWLVNEDGKEICHSHRGKRGNRSY